MLHGHVDCTVSYGAIEKIQRSKEAIGVSDVVYVLSHGPRASVRARHEVAIERPRRMIEVRQHAAFGTLMEALWAQLAEEPVTSDGAGGP